MPRYYRKRYTRVVKPKKRWASNMKEIKLTTNTTIEHYGGMVELCKNATQSALPTPVIVKTGNFKVQCDVVTTPGTGLVLSSLIAYVIYLPEGAIPAAATPGEPTPAEVYTFLTGMINAHPEWIMAWRQVGYDAIAENATSADRVTFSSRLKRNLNSGDRVVFALVSAGAVSGLALSGMCQFWTCAN